MKTDGDATWSLDGALAADNGYTTRENQLNELAV